MCNSEIMQSKELINSKSNEVNDWKQKLQNQAETFKLETTKKEEDILSKEQRIQQLLENCKNLEKRVVEYSQARSEVEEKSASSLEEIKALKESSIKARDEVAALKEEREMMISAHHNRIEQLRESFKKKMEEADAWPGKLDKIVQEKEAQFNEEKNNMWKELTEAFQKEIDEEQQKHHEELVSWKTEAKAAQDKFREDISTLSRKHREEVKRLERTLNEAKEKSEQTKNANNSIIQNLEGKIVDLENRLRQPSAESAEEVRKLRTRLQESERRLQEAEQQIDELETKNESWRQEVSFLQETVRRECEERLELTDALGEARAQLLALKRTSGDSISRSSLNSSSSISSGSLTRGSAKPGYDVNGLNDSAQATSCAVGFDGGVGYRPGTGARETGRSSRAGSVDDSRQRIAAAVRRSGTKSRLGGNFSS
ncbi:leucine-, glutamate- and lysine-rich protein 1-like [Orbicella faveolata]|uniref:leucine-, glutamate- and lysine-rich protein 1-like n=1 Tax=Orbicella faveolata TaxID=48498 RepID=UPI0009E2D1D3|nr:leucine-, glutamate- and lysine-rich protein 1-like [Orbicella faveolata]